MNVITTKKELRQKITEYKNKNVTIGFVPTMGFLHEGHLKLLDEARKANDIVVLSVFVNPLQFGPNEDFDSYPRNIKRDEELAKLAGVDLLFSPSVNEMYPNKPSYTVTVTSRVHVLCGRSREGHFDGVATILTKLFNLIEPNRAYFGMKDAQQVAVIDGLINEFEFPVQLEAVETIREEDGLAKSSRNVYLSEKERKQAPSIYKSLLAAKQLILQGERNKTKINHLITHIINEETDGNIDYVETLSYPDLEEVEIISGKCIIAVAVKFTGARLIDNITIEVQ
ncbi:pantoate--beta-alanine ligase [Metabacillus sediminilitoris]|uniref:Pantothenate synthetase n=1 Tax=Metabacillus sediminilitoris TaxID=2567941 RepID=A0A4S4C5E2_9BACI|nr:pantoate--beta-alanine ligase [Metabacillus sediminilitoris]QGQ46664.1 pantoate--beta-alanine ligase [Metabacillus sediminilitoris]THF82814.1 pantoate--beta-alanine ligase [Metabacillus sediminilitoris]